MTLLALGTFLTWSAFVIACVAWQTDSPSGLTSAMLVLIATSTAWAGAELFNILLPLRMLDSRVHARRYTLLCGIQIGTLGVPFTLLLLPLLDQFIADELTVGIATTLATSMVLVWQARVHPGHCIHCDYARAQLSPSSPCPECGKPAAMLAAHPHRDHHFAVTAPAARE